MKTIYTDVLVLGGGSAGCFAAISAARTGAKTLLIEKNGALGGTTTIGRVNFPGLFHAWGKQIISGPCWEAILRCVEYGGCTLPEFPYKSKYHYQQQILVDVFTYTYVLDEMCAEAGVNVMFHSMLAAVSEETENVKVILATKDGICQVNTKVMIDATGDADGIRMAGYEYLVSPQTQPATLINDLDGYDPTKIVKEDFYKWLEARYECGEITREDSQGEGMYKSIKTKRIHMHVSAPDAHTYEGKTNLEINSRRALFRILSCLRKYPGLENIRVSNCAVECGVRETVRIKGEKTITSEEYLSGEVQDDSVCYAFYPIDLHQNVGIKQIFLDEGKIPCVSYGSLVPKGSKRILVAGRCISSDADANSALRVQATCMATGQVVGVAASLCAIRGTNVCDLSIETLKESLKHIGAIVPQTI